MPMVGFAIFFDSRKALAAGVTSHTFFSAIEFHAPQAKTLEYVEARTGFISAALIDVPSTEAMDALMPALLSLARHAGVELYFRPNPSGAISIRENQGRFFNGLLEPNPAQPRLL